MTQSMIRRTLKNLVQNYSEAEVKVREATSNDPWGPSSSQMADISDLTYNVVACGEIMGMLWKRLGDDKNWRHVYKSLTLLEYLLKTGSDRIPKQSQENIHIIKPLVEYFFIDKDGKDQGLNVREKAKIVLVLIQDDEKRKEEREFAMKTKDKLAAGSTDSNEKAKAQVPAYTGLPSLDNIPSVADLTASMEKKKEEQRRLEEQRKEAERRAKEGDTEPDLWEQAAATAPTSSSDPWGAPSGVQKDTASNDPWGAPSDNSKGSGLGSVDPWGGSADGVKDSATASSDPWGGPAGAEKQSPHAQNDPWGDSAKPTEDKGPASADPWGTSSDLQEVSQPSKADPWGAPADSTEVPAPASSDPWGTQEPPAAKSGPWGGDGGTSAASTTDPFGNGAKADDDPWGTSGSSPLSANDPWGAPAAPTNTTGDPFSSGGSSDTWGAPADGKTNGAGDLSSTVPLEDSKKTPSFLGEGASLVDLDSLMSVKPKPKQLPLSALSASGQKAQGILPSPKPHDCIITNSSTDICSPLPSSQNVFGLAPMTVPSSLAPLDPIHGTPGPLMASTAHGTTQNLFGLGSMNIPSCLPSLNPTPGAPGAQIAPTAHGTTQSIFSLASMNVPSSLASLSPTSGAPGAHVASTVHGTSQNLFGLGPINIPSSLPTLNTTSGTAGAHMAPTAHGTTQNVFGFASMNVAPLIPTSGAPGPHVAPTVHGTTLTGFNLPIKDAPLATMQAGVMPFGTMGPPNGGMQTLSLGEAAAHPMGVRPGLPQQPPLVLGQGTGKATEENNDSLLF